MKICDIRRRNGGWNAVVVDVETVSLGREIDGVFLLQNSIKQLGSITCERTLFRHADKP